MKRGCKHLSGKERIQIEGYLDIGQKVSDIAKVLGKASSTILREIKKHVKVHQPKSFGAKNHCEKSGSCVLCGICVTQDVYCRNRRCASCGRMNCNSVCKDYVLRECARRLTYPGEVCNSCRMRATTECKKKRHIYRAFVAQEEYQELLIESRNAKSLTPEEKETYGTVLRQGLSNHQSINHIYQANKEIFKHSKRTVERLAMSRYFERVNLSNLPMAGRTRLRKKPKQDYLKEDPKFIVGRDYEDYQDYLKQHANISIVMMDTVIGVANRRKCLLTLHFVDVAFMVAFLMSSKRAQRVISQFNTLEQKLGKDVFSRLFPLLLTDRGTEFSNPVQIETRDDGSLRTHVFYCDAMNSNQKSQIERNHRILREIFEKGQPFSSWTQEKVNFALSHVNSLFREVRSNRTPYDLFTEKYGSGVAEKLGIVKINPRDTYLHRDFLERFEELKKRFEGLIA